jgi:hypothetical protein
MFKILDVYNESFIEKEIFGIVLSEFFYWTTFHFHLTFGIFFHSYLLYPLVCLFIDFLLTIVELSNFIFRVYRILYRKTLFSPNLIRSNNLSFRLQKIQKNISKIFQLVILNIIFMPKKLFIISELFLENPVFSTRE